MYNIGGFVATTAKLCSYIWHNVIEHHSVKEYNDCKENLKCKCATIEQFVSVLVLEKKKCGQFYKAHFDKKK